MHVERTPGSAPSHARDQTVKQLRRVQQQLAEAEEKYRALVERAVGSVFRTTPSGQFLMANQTLASMPGILLTTPATTPPDYEHTTVGQDLQNPQRSEAIAQPSLTAIDLP